MCNLCIIRLLYFLFRYATEHSSWVFETPEELEARESSIDTKWDSLTALSQSKKAALEESLRQELEKERLRLEFAHIASEFERWKKDTVDNVLSDTQFGFTLADVGAHAAVLDKSDSETLAAAEAKDAESAKVYADMQAAGAKDNIYTASTPEQLSDFSLLRNAIATRRAAYGRELEKQRAHDALCLQFASLAEPFSKWISDQKETITTSKDTLEKQLLSVELRIGSVESDGAKLVPIREKSDEIEAAGITNNVHTSLTYVFVVNFVILSHTFYSYKDLEVQWNQYRAFLERKKQMLVEEIENVKLRGLTAEQLQEIQDNFTLFDSNKSGSIDKKELKACLYSLGEEKGKAEIDDIIAKYGRQKEQDITYQVWVTLWWLVQMGIDISFLGLPWVHDYDLWRCRYQGGDNRSV